MAAFTVGEYEVTVWKDQGRWAVSVDEAVHRRWYGSEAQAAGAGLIRAQRKGRNPSPARLATSAPSEIRSCTPPG
jgi:hypothetical protein